MKVITFIVLILSSIHAISQTSYSGFLGKFPITFVSHHYGDGVTRAYYVYNKYDTPITINGNLKNKELKLFEKNSKGRISATLTFSNFKEGDDLMNGKWFNADSTKIYDISLQKDFSIDSDDDIEWKTKELIQSNSTKNHYFKTIISKSKEDFYARISGIKVFEKKTDRLIQTIELDCQLLGIDNVTVKDYNFDGISDFSVFEASYAGPNTTSLYFLYNSNTKKYFESNFSGVSLEFDNKTERIFERNQCCAGSIVTTAEYKVVNNEMVLIKEHCYKWDDEKEELIEREMKACQ